MVEVKVVLVVEVVIRTKISMTMNTFNLNTDRSPVVQYARRFAIGKVILVDNCIVFLQKTTGNSLQIITSWQISLKQV